MKNAKLKMFLKIIQKAVAIVLLHDDIGELVSFNGYNSVEEYYRYLISKSQKAFFNYLKNVKKFSDNAMFYHKFMINHLDKVLSYFVEDNGSVFYEKLFIKDTEGRYIKWEELPPSLKKKICPFLAVQKEVVADFLYFLDQPENTPFQKPYPVNGYSTSSTQSNTTNILNEPVSPYPSEKLAEGDRWMDGEEVCLFLKISRRTLQRYRENNILCYTQIGGKFFYKYFDVLKLLNKKYNY